MEQKPAGTAGEPCDALTWVSIYTGYGMQDTGPPLSQRLTPWDAGLA